MCSPSPDRERSPFGPGPATQVPGTGRVGAPEPNSFEIRTGQYKKGGPIMVPPMSFREKSPPGPYWRMKSRNSTRSTDPSARKLLMCSCRLSRREAR